MQKKIIALAVAAAASGAAFAQSNVTIYGVVDQAYVVQDASPLTGSVKSTNRIEGGGMMGNRLGFKGTEDLGNGLKALFTLEYTITPDANSGVGDAASVVSGSGNIATSSQSRQTYVGLSTPYGTVLAGRLQGAGYYFGATYSTFAGTLFDNAALLGSTDTLNGGSAARLNNAVAFVSPTFAGFTAEWDHARVTETASTAGANTGGTNGSSDSTANELSLKYANGPLSAQGIYVNVSNSSTLTADSYKQWGLGAAYDFGVAKVTGLYKTKKLQSATAALNDKEDKMWALGVSVPVGAKGTILANYAQSSIDTTNVNGDADAKSWGLGYRYALSKRTTAYVNYTQINQDRNGTLANTAGYVAANAVGSQQNVGAGADTKIYGVGVAHAF